MGFCKVLMLILLFNILRLELIKTDILALKKCREQTVDLVLVADAAAICRFENNEPNRQMSFFSNLIDIFSQHSENTMNRLRVSLLVATRNETTNYPTIEQRITFGAYNNKETIKEAITAQNISCEQYTHPLEAIRTVNIMYQNKTNMAHGNTTLVIVLIGRRQNINVSYTSVDLKRHTNMLNNNIHVKLFMIVVNDRPINILKINSNVAVYKVSQIHDDLPKILAFLLCHDCYLGWFDISAQTPNFSRSVKASCYKLAINDKPLSWIEANGLCHQDTSQLVSFESASELVSLRKNLSNKFIELGMYGSFTDNVAIHIGLRRLESTLGTRFRWVNNNPLVFTQWGNSQPQGGYIFGCVLWELSNLTSYSNTTEKGIQDDEAMMGTWTSVGCGHTKTRFYLCEYTINIPLESHSLYNKKYKRKLNRPNNQSILKAVERGELGFNSNHEALMSLPTLLKMWKCDSDLNRHYAYDNHNFNQTVSLNVIKLYHCEGSDGKIPYTSVCDFSNDCPYPIEERNCRSCSDSEKECPISKKCISENVWCDLYNDCKGSFDEKNCHTCKHGVCPDGRCLPKNWFADGEIDCAGSSFNEKDTFEVDYAQKNDFAHCLFTCNRTQCIYDYMLEDGVTDCNGPEGPIDKTMGALESTTCYIMLDNMTSRFSNWGPKCIYVLDIYGEVLGCINMRHLLDCENFPCPEGYYKCPQSYCIPTHYFHDGKNDCPHGEDEEFDQPAWQCPYYFICQGQSSFRNLLCLHPDLVCDGRVDCPEGDDEQNCFVSCQEGFICLSGTVVYTKTKKTKTGDLFEFIHPETRYLDMSRIDLSTMFPMIFFDRSLFNLNEVIMSDCNIVDTFLNTSVCLLDTIRHIDLSFNNIKNISTPSVFRCMASLNFLNLSHNEFLTNFQNIESEITSVKKLDLSYTGLSFLRTATFSSLKNLKYLNLMNTFILNVRFLPSTNIEILDLRGTAVNNEPYADMFKNVTISSQLYTDSFKLCCPQLHNSKTNLDVCLSTKDPFSSCSDLMSNNVLRIILWTDGILAVSGNFAVIIYRLFFDRSILKTAYGHFVTHLSISDLIMGVYLAIIAVADYSFRGIYVWKEWSWRHSIVCNAAGFLSTLSTEVSTMFIFLITLDRYLVIRYPFGQFRIDGWVVKLCCVVTWMLGAMIAMFPLLPVFNYLKAYSTNGMCLGLPLTNNCKTGREFAIAVFIFLNFFMFLIIACGQIAIYKTVSVMRMNQSSLANTTSRRAQDLALAKNLCLIAFTNFLCWFPTGVMGIMVLCGYTIGTEAYAWSAVLVMPINSAINPFLYTVPALFRKLGQLSESGSLDRSKVQ